MKKNKTLINLFIISCLFSSYSLAAQKTFNASKTVQPTTAPTYGEPYTATATWTDGEGKTATVTDTAEVNSEGEITTSAQGSGGKGVTLTETSNTTTDNGYGSVTDYSGETNNGQGFTATSTYSQPTNAQGQTEGQEEYNITGDASPENTLTITDDYGGTNYGTYESSGSTVTGGSESGSATTSSTTGDKTGSIEVTPGTTSQYYGNTYDIEYTITPNGTASGTVNEEPAN